MMQPLEQSSRGGASASPHFFIPAGLPRWPGETVAILGGGLSLRGQQKQVDHCRDRCRTIAINRAGVPAPAGEGAWINATWADMLHAHDEWFWKNHPSALAHRGVKTTGQAPIDPRVILIKMAPKEGGAPFVDPRRPIHTGRDSGYQAIQIAALLGAARVLLLGFDCRPTGNWHGGYNRHNARATDTYDWHLAYHRDLKVILDARGVEVINCTPESAIDAYPLMPIYEALS